MHFEEKTTQLVVKNYRFRIVTTHFMCVRLVAILHQLERNCYLYLETLLN